MCIFIVRCFYASPRSGVALDVALFRFIRGIGGLPRESGRVDRVIEAFNRRYVELNPSWLAASRANPQLTVFSPAAREAAFPKATPHSAPSTVGPVTADGSADLAWCLCFALLMLNAERHVKPPGAAAADAPAP